MYPEEQPFHKEGPVNLNYYFPEKRVANIAIGVQGGVAWGRRRTSNDLSLRPKVRAQAILE